MERGANAPAESEAAAQSDAQRAQDFLQAQQHYYRQLRTHRQDLAKFKESRREHLAAVEMLGELPKKTRHGIMVPLGKMAFVPGELIHTNEVLVLLGDNYFAERSACQAAEIMQRRIEVIDRVISTTEKNIKDLAARSNFSQEARQALLRKMEIDTVGGPPAVPAEVEERADEDDDDEGLGQDFWNAVGFVGTFASDYHDDLDHDSEEDNDDDPAYGPAGGLSSGAAEWDDDEGPVLEICEPVDGGEARVITHANQRAFEESETGDGLGRGLASAQESVRGLRDL